MNDTYTQWIYGRGAGPLAIRMPIFVLGLLGLGCQKAPEPLMSAGRTVESGAPRSGPASTAPAGSDPCGSTAPGEQSGCETALLAGGCFWGMEEILRQIPGVIDVEVGYTGGTTLNPRYKDVRTGFTGHAESVRVVFDPSRISYAELLEKYFFRMHDPTTKNRQGNDFGTQYRSAIFVATPEQRATAEEIKARVGASGFWRDPIVTEIVDAGPFTLAEDEHQDYLQKHPNGYTCHYMRS